jgi:hypothetical protein
MVKKASLSKEQRKPSTGVQALKTKGYGSASRSELERMEPTQDKPPLRGCPTNSLDRIAA